MLNSPSCPFDPAKRPQWVRDYERTSPGWDSPFMQIEVDGRPTDYALVKMGSEPLPYNVGCYLILVRGGIANSIDRTIYFLSENVEERFRSLILRSEMRQTYAYKSRETRYITALCKELEEAAEELSPADYVFYVTQRRDYFDALVPFSEENPEQTITRCGYNFPEFLAGIKQCQAFFRQIVAIMETAQANARAVEEA
jgi:hypothetical protein